MKDFKNSQLFSYISDGQKDLLSVGEHLLEHVKSHNGETMLFDDYSFVVFPFAKAYEGFLKQVFLDRRFISRGDYVSKFFRVGKAMSPNLAERYGDRSVYKQICDDIGCDLSDQIWETWKMARNEVFHYFPHNIRSLTLQEAEERIDQILKTMEDTVNVLQLPEHK